MNRVRVENGKDRLRLFLPLTGLLFVLLWAMATNAKMATDFNPNLDFSKYKTFAYTGGVESLVMMQLNPELLNNRIHRAVLGELTGKGLREVQPEQKSGSTNAVIVHVGTGTDLSGFPTSRT